MRSRIGYGYRWAEQAHGGYAGPDRLSPWIYGERSVAPIGKALTPPHRPLASRQKSLQSPPTVWASISPSSTSTIPSELTVRYPLKLF